MTPDPPTHRWHHFWIGWHRYWSHWHEARSRHHENREWVHTFMTRPVKATPEPVRLKGRMGERRERPAFHLDED